MILEQCKGVHCVDLGESFQTYFCLQNLASIPPRTREKTKRKNAKRRGPLLLRALRGEGEALREARGGLLDALEVQELEHLEPLVALGGGLGGAAGHADAFAEHLLHFFTKFANFWRTRSRLYQNEIFQESMRLKTLDEIYIMHSFAPFLESIIENFAPFCNLNFSLKIAEFL